MWPAALRCLPELWALGVDGDSAAARNMMEVVIVWPAALRCLPELWALGVDGVNAAAWNMTEVVVVWPTALRCLLNTKTTTAASKIARV